MSEIKNELLDAVREIDRALCCDYFRKELIELGFDEFSEGCFKYSDTFRVAFRVNELQQEIPALTIVHRPEGGAERQYKEHINIRSISQLLLAYKKLEGKPL